MTNCSNEGDWADTNPRANTDRTQSTIELVDKIEKLETENRKLTKWLDSKEKWLNLKSEYINKLEFDIRNYCIQIEQLKCCLFNLRNYIKDETLLNKINEVLK